MKYIELPYYSPEQIYTNIAHLNGSVWLDSASQQQQNQRYSYITYDPFLTLRSKNGQVQCQGITFQADPFSVLAEKLQQWQISKNPELPPLQGGIIGYFGYELNQHLENIPQAKLDALNAPDLILGFYDLIIAFDHQLNKCWLISTGLPETDNELRQQRAEQRLQQAQLQLKLNRNIQHTRKPEALHTHLKPEQFTSNFTQANYLTAVEKIKNYIYAGDIYQANLSQCFSALVEPFSTLDFYLRFRHIAGEAFSGLLNFGSTQLLATSPERFIQCNNGKITTCPIKGTRPRHADPHIDLQNQNELLQSEKERAENTMIVDLIRNDLSKVCQPNTVNVEQLCAIESFAHVHHLVSTIHGQLQPQKTAVDLLRAVFPGGSITGAPKIRAMEIIAELEPNTRGPYCGCFGYLSFTGDTDLAITIRTVVLQEQSNHWQFNFQVGGAITAESDPQAEFEETLHKAQGFLKTLGNS